MNDLAAQRAHKARDNRLWSPTDALEDALRRVRTAQRPVQGLLVVWWERGDEEWTQHYSAAGLSNPEGVGLLTRALHDATHNWNDD